MITATYFLSGSKTLTRLLHGHEHTKHHHDHNSDLSSLIGHKIGAIIFLLFITLVGCVIPVFLKRTSKHQKLVDIALDLVNSFAGGAFLGLGLFHLLPEATAQVKAASIFIYMNGHAVASAGYILVFTGYALLLLLEHVLVNGGGCHNVPIDSENSPKSVNILGSHAISAEPSLCTSGKIIFDCNSFDPKLESICDEAPAKFADITGLKTNNTIDSTPSSLHSCKDIFKGSVWLDEESCCAGVSEGLNSCKCGCGHCEQSLDAHGMLRSHDSLRKPEQIGERGSFGHFPLSIETPSADCQESIVPPKGRLIEKFWELLRVLLMLFNKPAFFVCLSLAVHSLFEGMIVGAAVTLDDVWIPALVIVGHKGATAVAISTIVLKAKLPKLTTWSYLLIFIVASPVGVGLGMVIVSGGNTALAAVVNAVATGTVLYISNQIITGEFMNGGSLPVRIVKYLGFLIGALVIFGLSLLHFHDH